MKTLIVEDDFTSRVLLQALLQRYGENHIAVNGMEAIQAFQMALAEEKPYDLICLDILMPGMNGHEVLKEIRRIEQNQGIFSTDGVKIIMITALDDLGNAFDAFHELCDAYLTKPIDKAGLIDLLITHHLVQ